MTFVSTCNRFSFLALYALTAVGCQNIRQSTADARFIGGLSATDEQFPASVLLRLPRGTCGATKIGPRTFITAAHCISEGEVRVGSELNARVGSNAATQQSFRVAVTSIRTSDTVAPGLGDRASNESEVMGLDLATFEIDREIPGLRTAVLDKATVRNGEKVVVSGFGCQRESPRSPELPSDAQPEGSLRYGILTVSEFSTYHYLVGQYDDQGREARGCKGDSGQAVFRNDVQGPYLNYCSGKCA